MNIIRENYLSVLLFLENPTFCRSFRLPIIKIIIVTDFEQVDMKL